MLFFVSCQKEDKKYVNDPACKHSLQSDSLKILWKAYKFTDRVSVSGGIERWELHSAQNVDLAQLLSSVSLKFNLGHLRSDLPERDANVRKYFVSQMAQGGDVIAQVVQSSANTLWVKLSMNGQTRQIPCQWMITGSQLHITTRVDLDSFALHSAMSELSRAVAPMHTGSDGVAMMWPDLDLEFQVPLSSECQE